MAALFSAPEVYLPHTARNPPAMNVAMRFYTAAKSSDWQRPPDSLSMRPVAAGVNTPSLACEHQWTTCPRPGVMVFSPTMGHGRCRFTPAVVMASRGAAVRTQHDLVREIAGVERQLPVTP